MYNNYTSQISPDDRYGNRQVDDLLAQEGIRRDRNLDYTCGVFDEDQHLIATGSCFGNTLRCFAVDKAHQGEGLINTVISHLINIQFDRGNAHLFLYTKDNTALFFADLGFYKVVELSNQLVFMENRRTGFADYLEQLKPFRVPHKKAAAIVMNANPFSFGHLYLVEKAAAENDLVHVFIVSEDSSLVPFAIRKRLVMEGTAHLKNICYHDSGSYIISKATFPSYFQKDEESVIRGQALLDITIFSKIAKVLDIQRRYVGEEPNSQVTNIYNQIMKDKLPEYGIECLEIPRKCHGEVVISASVIRDAIKKKQFDKLIDLVPKTTLNYFLSAEAETVIKKIQAAEEVNHY